MCFGSGMKTLNISVASLMVAGFLAVGCAKEISHSESSKPNLLDDGRTTKSETTVRNPDGTTSTEMKKTRTSE